jgi:hypothetical protein
MRQGVKKSCTKNRFWMYAPIMWKRFGKVLLMMAAAWSLLSCRSASRQTATPIPESEQEIGASIKELYMRASSAPPHSREQQNLILQMANEASNGKELLLAMRATVGVFPAAAAANSDSLEDRVHSRVTAKMLTLATLDQLLDYAASYPVAARDTRPLVERMIELGGTASEPRLWYRIRAAASRLGLSDLAREAQARAEQAERR